MVIPPQLPARILQTCLSRFRPQSKPEEKIPTASPANHNPTRNKHQVSGGGLRPAPQLEGTTCPRNRKRDEMGDANQKASEAHVGTNARECQTAVHQRRSPTDIICDRRLVCAAVCQRQTPNRYSQDYRKHSDHTKSRCVGNHRWPTYLPYERFGRHGVPHTGTAVSGQSVS